MAASQWMEIYRSYTAEELAVEVAEARADLKGAYAAAATGSTSHERNIPELVDRLQAATRVRNERAGDWDSDKRHGVVDFGGTDISQL